VTNVIQQRAPRVARPLLSLLIGVVSLAGCGAYHWTKPGGTLVGFTEDHRECARASAILPDPRRPDYGVVNETVFRECMKGRGWQRGLPPSGVIQPGWFRGVEDEGLVKLDEIPPQPTNTDGR
jgi:hypothetical protein